MPITKKEAEDNCSVWIKEAKDYWLIRMKEAEGYWSPEYQKIFDDLVKEIDASIRAHGRYATVSVIKTLPCQVFRRIKEVYTKAGWKVHLAIGNYSGSLGSEGYNLLHIF